MWFSKIAIIWGTSDFGKWWQNFFERKGFEVIVSSRNTPKTPEQAAKEADVIIISVTIRYTLDVINNIIKYLPPDKLLMDFTGIKDQATKELSKYNEWEVVATHPMFWPWVDSLENQNIAYDPVKPGKKRNKMYKILEDEGAFLIQLDSKTHDEIVSLLQSTIHFLNLLLGYVLRKRQVNLKDLNKICTPNSRMQLFLMSRFLKQHAGLYTDMQMHNEVYKDEIIPEIKEFVNYLENMIENNDVEKFQEEFEKIKEFVGEDFIDKWVDITSKIDKNLKDNI